MTRWLVTVRFEWSALSRQAVLAASRRRRTNGRTDGRRDRYADICLVTITSFILKVFRLSRLLTPTVYVYYTLNSQCTCTRTNNVTRCSYPKLLFNLSYLADRAATSCLSGPIVLLLNTANMNFLQLSEQSVANVCVHAHAG